MIAGSRSRTLLYHFVLSTGAGKHVWACSGRGKLSRPLAENLQQALCRLVACAKPPDDSFGRFPANLTTDQREDITKAL